MRAFDDLVRQGKVLYVGVSDAAAWWIAQANTLAQLRGWSPFVGLQMEYSLIERTFERELIPMAKALDVGVTARSPLAGGVPSGKYHGNGQSEPRRMDNEMAKDSGQTSNGPTRSSWPSRRCRPTWTAAWRKSPWLASLSPRHGYSHHRRSQAFPVAGKI